MTLSWTIIVMRPDNLQLAFLESACTCRLNFMFMQSFLLFSRMPKYVKCSPLYNLKLDYWEGGPLNHKIFAYRTLFLDPVTQTLFFLFPYTKSHFLPGRHRRNRPFSFSIFSSSFPPLGSLRSLERVASNLVWKIPPIRRRRKKCWAYLLLTWPMMGTMMTPKKDLFAWNLYPHLALLQF